MEKKLYELKIDPELRDYIPPLTEIELEMLTESLLDEGCLEPIVTWNGTIVDGHNRYCICRKNSIPFAVEEQEFNSKEDVMFWMMRKQIGRRNLKPFQRCELVYPHEKRISEEVEKHRREAIRRARTGNETGTDLYQSKRAGEYMADYADVAYGTWFKAKAIIEKGNDEIKAALRKADLTIDAAYKKMHEKKPDQPEFKEERDRIEAERDGGSPKEKTAGMSKARETEKTIDSSTFPDIPRLEEPLEVPQMEEEPERTPRPFEYVRDQVQFSIQNMLKELRIGLDWLRDEDKSKSAELISILNEGFDRAEDMIKEAVK